MRWQYDLVFVGSSFAALQGSIEAAKRLRVGLVLTPPSQPDPASYLDRAVLQALLSQIPSTLTPSEKRLWLQGQLSGWAELYAPAALSQAGVDVIQGCGKFQPGLRGRNLELVIGDDYLQAKAFVIVDAPEIICYRGQELTLSDLFKTLPELADTPVFVPGQTLQDLVWVQLCLALEIPVAWGGDFSQLLPKEDALVLEWLSSDLQQRGVEFSPDSNPLSDSAHTLETVITPLENAVPGLGELGILNSQGQIQVNQHLRTRQPQLWACGSCLGGYGLPMITQAEVTYLVDAFGCNKTPQPLNYKPIPWWLASPIPMARVGWSAAAAEMAFNSGITVLPVQPEQWGLGQGQIVINPKNQLLGATLWGNSAITAVKTLGLGMEQRLVRDCLAAAGWQLAIHPRQLNLH